MSYKIDTYFSTERKVASFEKKISICQTSNGFSFSVRTDANDLVSIGSFTLTECNSMIDFLTSAKNALHELKIETFGLHEVELITIADQFVWVPNELYDDAKKNKYLDAVCAVRKGMAVFSDYNKAIDSHVVFAADKNITS